MNTQYTPEQQAIRQWLSKPYPMSSACGCLGPRANEPVCPCAMQFVELVGESYYKIEEHRCPDGVTHTAKKIADVADCVSQESRILNSIIADIKQMRDEKGKGITYAVKELRHRMYQSFNVSLSIKDALDAVREM